MTFEEDAASSVRRRWVVVGVVLALAVPGTLLLGWQSNVPGGGGLPHSVVVTIGTSQYDTILCNGVRPEYFETRFPVIALTGTLQTSEFTLSLLTFANATISANGSAPSPSPGLPCGAPTPAGWYVFLSHDTAGAVATYPTPAVGIGPPVWSNSSRAPATVTVGDEFVFETVADFSGTGDHVTAVSEDGFDVTLAGDTTFPPFENP
jgi:hypothetical protein